MEKLNGDPSLPTTSIPFSFPYPAKHFLLLGRVLTSESFIFSHPQKLPSKAHLRHVSFHVIIHDPVYVDVCLFVHPKAHFDKTDIVDGFPLCDFLTDPLGGPLIFTFSSDISLVFPHLYLPVTFDDKYIHLLIQPVAVVNVAVYSFVRFSDTF